MALKDRIKSSEFRWRIAIVKPNGTQDSMGGVSQNPTQWTPVLTCWAKIESGPGKDVHATESFVQTTTHRITIRNPRTGARDPDQAISSQMYVWFKTRTFEINAVLNPRETNKLLILMCTEINQSNQQITTPSPT